MSTLKHVISPDRATELTSRYEKNSKKILKDEFKEKDTLPVSETFDRAAFDKLLSQEGCVGIRIYLGMDEKHEVSLVVRGINAKNEDISALTSKTKKTENRSTDDEPVLALASGVRCPPYCTPPPPPPPPPDEL
jgi:hypothetical protein